MKRVLVGTLAAMLGFGSVISASTAQAEDKKAGAEAKPEKKKKKGKKEKGAPASPQIAESMKDIRWGMNRDELLKQFVDKVKEKYRPLVAKTKGAVEEDRLRQSAKSEIEEIRKGVVEFDGRSTGWNVSFLKGEFSHNNDESMLVVRDANSQNFYFFIGGKLWKWYKAFDASVFPAGNFGTFAAAVQRKFGNAKDAEGEIRPGVKRHWLEWQDKGTRLRAVDQSDFYGFYCLVFEEKATVGNLAKLRSNAEPEADKKHAMVESVTAERSENPDDSPNIADRITGRLRQSEQAPESAPDSQTAAAGKGKSKDKDKDKDKASAPVESSDDPISGLGL
jgi:hypothetical protein